MNSSLQQIRPRRSWYVIAAIVLAAGIAVFAALLISFITGLVGIADSMTRVVAPGTFDIKLDKPGTYTIFHEYRSVIGGRVYNTDNNVGSLTCTLTDKSSGRPIPVTATSTSSTYSAGPYAGRAIFEATISTPGDYTLSAQNADAPAGQQGVLSIDRDFTARLFGTVIKLFVAIGALVGSILVSVLIFVITIIQRSRASRRLKATAPPLPPPVLRLPPRLRDKNPPRPANHLLACHNICVHLCLSGLILRLFP